MDQSVKLLVERIRAQLGSVLKESGRDLAGISETCAHQNSRSPNGRNKLDESGISSEEGCLPWPVYSQLADIALLVNQLETVLEPEPIAGCGPMAPGAVPERGRDREDDQGLSILQGYVPELAGSPWSKFGNVMAGKNDSSAPVVYSRSSAQLMYTGETPKLDSIVQKDGGLSRRAEVTIWPARDFTGDYRWTRSGLRTGHRSVNYLESFSSSEFSSSDGEMSSGPRSGGDRKRRRRTRKKRQTQRPGKEHRISRVTTMVRERSTDMVTSTEEDSEQIPAVPVVTVSSGEREGEGDDSGMLESDEDKTELELELPLNLPLFLASSPCVSSGSSETLSEHTVLRESNECFHKHGGPRLSSKAFSGKEMVGTIDRVKVVSLGKVVKPCSVAIERLPHDTVQQYLHSRVKNPTPSGHVNLLTVHSNSESSLDQSDSESVSMLAGPPTPRGRSLSPRPLTREGDLSTEPTPLRLGPRGRLPVARRSLPFSKPPKSSGSLLPPAHSAHSTTGSVSPASSETFLPLIKLTKSPSPLRSVSNSPSLFCNLSHSPSPLHTLSHSPSPLHTLSRSPSPLHNLSRSPSPLHNLSHSPSPLTSTPSPPPNTSSHSPSPSKRSSKSNVPAVTATAGSITAAPSASSNALSTPSRASSSTSAKPHSSKSPMRRPSVSPRVQKTPLSLLSTQRRGKANGIGRLSSEKKVAIGWSSDEDFEGTPTPSLVASPAVGNRAGMSRTPHTPSVKTEPKSVTSPALSGSVSPTSSSSLAGPLEGMVDEALMKGAVGDGRGREGAVGRSSVEVAAHSATGEPTSNPAEGLPTEIACAGCGRSIHWRSEHIHKHKRLDVLICQGCWKVYNTGSFEKAEGKEIYCTLCGDGGSIISCDNDSCSSSFCESCIRRICGEQALRQLVEDETMKWQCFCCDTRPLVVYQSLCKRLCDYYTREGKEKFDRVGGSQLCGGVRVTETKGGEVGGGGGGGGVSGDRGSRRGKENERKTDSSGNRELKSSGEGEGEGGGGGDKKRPNRRKRVDNLSDSEVESSSCAEEEEDSPVVDTDNVSLSDTSLFEGDASSLRKRASHDRGELSKASKRETEQAGEAEGQNRRNSSTSSSGSMEVEKKAKKKRKFSLSLFGQRARLDNESDSDFESVPTKRSPQNRLASTSSNSSSGVGERGREKRERKSRRNSLLVILSSDGEGEGTPEKVKTEVYELGGESSMRALSPAHLSTPEFEPGPVVYATPRKLSVSSDSDDDVSVLERKPRHIRVFGSDSSSGMGEENTSSTKPGQSKDAEEKKDMNKIKKKRKRLGSSGDEFESRGQVGIRGPLLKRRRVARALMSDSDSSNDDDDSVGEGEGVRGEDGEEGEEEEEKTNTPGKKRKKIRRMMADTKLQSSTREAQQAERERIERLKKRRVSVGQEKENELVLEENPATKQPLIKVRQSLVKSIKPHQWEGIRFLYDACVEKLAMFREGRTQAGAILAHCMGLGKTLQVIALVDALLMHADSGVEKVLVLSPVNTIYNWRNEFERWIPSFDCDYNIFMLVDTAMNMRVRKLERWFSSGGVLFAGYEMFRNLAMGKRLRKKKKEAFEKYLLNPGPDIIVCDEGHVMRNASSNLSTVLQRVRTRARIVLTGTPLQNNLVEYHTMVSFVKPNLLGTLKEFKNRFANPITNGQCRDSTPIDVRIMKNRAHVLHEMLAGTVQRRDYRVLARFLPPKQEFVLFIRLSSVQEGLYTHYLSKSSDKHTASDLFSTFSNLQKVWNHPWVLKLDEDRKFEREERRRLDEDSDGEDSLDGFIVSGSEDEEEEEEERKRRKKRKTEVGSFRRSSSSSGPSRSITPAPLRATGTHEPTSIQPASSVITLCSSDEDELAFPAISLKPDPDAPTIRVTRSSKPTTEDSKASPTSLGVTSAPPSRSSSPPKWYDDLLTPDCEGSAGVSGKIQFLLQLLQETGKLKEKVLVFTQSLLTLDLIEEVLGRPENGDWTPGLDYYRLDGSTRSEMRTHQMTDFNEVDNEQLRLYLISTRAGSLGVNLVAANRVVIFDACWNPSHDLQAVFRSYRFGQTKPIFVYRLLAKGTMEEKIYDRQVTKESLAMRVVDEKQIGRHYNASDLAELFTYSPASPPPPPDERPHYERPEADKVLTSILEQLQPDWIVNYHEHDSLLKHVFSEELSEEERKAAWDDYRAQIAHYDNATYYSSLQGQIDAATEQLAPQPAMAQSMNGVAGASGFNTAHVNHAALISLQQRQQASLLITIITNTNRNVQALISLLRVRNSLAAQQEECRRRGMTELPPNLKGRVILNDKTIKEHYALVEEGVKRVNSTLQRCRSGEVHFDTATNGLVNSLRAQLIANLDTLKSGSGNPALQQHALSQHSMTSTVSSSEQLNAQLQAVLQQPRQP